WPGSWRRVLRPGTAPRTRPCRGAARPRPGRTAAAGWVWAHVPAVIRGAGAPGRTDLASVQPAPAQPCRDRLTCVTESRKHPLDAFLGQALGGPGDRQCRRDLPGSVADRYGQGADTTDRFVRCLGVAGAADLPQARTSLLDR